MLATNLTLIPGNDGRGWGGGWEGLGYLALAAATASSSRLPWPLLALSSRAARHCATTPLSRPVFTLGREIINVVRKPTKSVLHIE